MRPPRTVPPRDRLPADPRGRTTRLVLGRSGSPYSSTSVMGVPWPAHRFARLLIGSSLLINSRASETAKQVASPRGPKNELRLQFPSRPARSACRTRARCDRNRGSVAGRLHSGAGSKGRRSWPSDWEGNCCRSQICTLFVKLGE
jgi:hypothetical protein